MKKKIAILGSAWPWRGGLATYNERLAAEFIAQGHETIIYTFTLQYPELLFPGSTQYSDSPAPSGLNIKALLSSINPLSWLSTARAIRKFAPDVLIIKFWLPFMGPAFGTVARQVKKNKKTRVVSILDNVLPHEKRVGDLPFTRYFLKPVDAFIAMSEKVFNDLRSFDKKKPARIIPHPLYDNFGALVSKEKARKDLKIDHQGTLLLFFGFIRDYKGLDILLTALSKVKDPNVKLVVAGEYYTEAEPYHKIIEDLKLQDRVYLHTDFIRDDQVNLYFSAADLVVQPYKSATQSGVTQIAYHFNKPMVVTDVGGLAELVPHNQAGFVSQPDPTSVAEAINAFVALPSGHFDHSIAELKKRFSWKSMVDGILESAEQSSH